MSKATITLIGKIFRPEERKTPTGTPYTVFAISVGQNFKKPDGTWGVEYDWFNIASFSINLNKKILQDAQCVAVCNVRYKKDKDNILRLNLTLKELTILTRPSGEDGAKEETKETSIEDIDSEDLPF